MRPTKEILNRYLSHYAETARNAGCAFALVEWGFPRTPGSDGLDAGLIVATPRELVQKLVV